MQPNHLERHLAHNVQPDIKLVLAPLLPNPRRHHDRPPLCPIHTDLERICPEPIPDEHFEERVVAESPHTVVAAAVTPLRARDGEAEGVAGPFRGGEEEGEVGVSGGEGEWGVEVALVEGVSWEGMRRVWAGGRGLGGG